MKTKRALATLLGVAAVFGMTGCMSTPEAGQIGVVRNGGPFDDHNIRQIVQQGSGNTWVGWFSSTHYYPVYTQQRFFRFATCGSDDNNNPQACDGADAPGITVQTADGVDVTMQGTIYLNTVFGDPGVPQEATDANCSQEGLKGQTGNCLLRSFDTQFATRTFGGEHAYSGNGGWSKFLTAIVEPIVVNNLREVISGKTCADLVSSCALVQNQSTAAEDVAQKAKQGVNQTNIAQVQTAVGDGLSTDLQATLRRAYFENLKFAMGPVTLPGRIQDAIDVAQAAFAEVSQSAAKVKSARLDSQANEIKQSGYSKCPTCATIDATKAIPHNITVWAPGARYSVTGR